VAAPFDDGVFHRRSEPDGGKAHPWQRNWENLKRDADKRRARRNGVKPEVEWDEGPEYFDDEEDTTTVADVDDDDIW
jgi:hypothetical protein